MYNGRGGYGNYSDTYRQSVNMLNVREVSEIYQMKNDH